jgi:hypothetical protein
MTYPQWICMDCGLKHGKREPGLACWNVDKCDVCGEIKPCTEPRDFGHLKETFKSLAICMNQQ